MIKNITLKNIRCYENVRIDLDPGTNVFFAPNGTGKTTIVESVYFLSQAKSYKTGLFKNIIRHHQSFASIKIELENLNVLSFGFHEEKKTFYINEKPIRSAVELLKALPVVILAPEHCELINSHELKRKFVDQMTFYLEQDYLLSLKRLNQALKCKRALLKQNLSFHNYQPQVEPFNEIICEQTKQIRLQRTKTLKNIQGLLNQHFNVFFNGELEFVLDSRPIEDEIRKKLEKEFYSKRVITGAQLDEIDLNLNGVKIYKNLSQGEMSSLLLSLKLCEMDLLKSFKPILLLDDVTALLDEERQRALYEMLKNHHGQVLITSAQKSILNLFQRSKVFDGYHQGHWMSSFQLRQDAQNGMWGA